MHTYPILDKYSFKYNQQDATLHNILYCCQCCTCFRWLLRPSSGAQNCTHSIWYMSSLLAPTASKLDIYQMMCVQLSAPDNGRRNRLKHVEHWQQYRILCNVASCWLYLKEYINDTRSHDRQIWTSTVAASDYIKMLCSKILHERAILFQNIPKLVC
jgi:hypothetical protein